jgi:hypothetical protein
MKQLAVILFIVGSACFLLGNALLLWDHRQSLRQEPHS